MTDTTSSEAQVLSGTRRSLSAEERDVIWRAHNKKCVLTSEPVSYAELQVDHVIPLEGGVKIVVDLQKRGLIAADFDLNGTENLIPTKSTRNRQKGDAPLSESAMVYYLDLAKQKKDGIDEALKAETTTARLWSNMLKASADMGRNGYEPEEYFTILRSQTTGDASLRFPLDISGQDIRTANSAIAEQLMDMPFALGDGAFSVVGGENEAGVKAEFATPREFAQGVLNGFQPITSFEVNIWGAAERTTSQLQALRTQRFAPKSAIRFPRVTLQNLDRWSSRWITDWAWPDTETDVDELQARHPTIADLIAAKIATRDDAEESHWVASFHWDQGFSVKMFELLRADLDGDGEEEILVSCVGWVTDGTLRMPNVLMGKPDKTGLIVPADYNPPS